MSRDRYAADEFTPDEDVETPVSAPRVSPGKRSLTASIGQVRLVGAGTRPDPNVRQRVEGATGADLSDARVHTGTDSQQAAASMSARAFTTGSDMHFGAGQYKPGTADGDRLLAHELVHTAQQSEGAPAQRKPTALSQPGDAAEREADQIAQVALSGDSPAARVAPVERPALISRETIAGNPAERTNNAGAVLTQHRAPTLGDAINAPTAQAAQNEERTSNVRVVANQASPVHTEPPACPPTEQIYEESATQQSPPEPGFTTVARFEGTAVAPQVQQEANNSIFINGAPTGNDVQQMSIGDCYFLASLMSILQRDPGKIPSMMTADGNGGATVNFWRRQEHTPSFWERVFGGPQHDYIQVSVRVNNELAFNIANNRVHGAQLRCAEAPKSSDYWARIHGDALQVHRKDVFECARWAPLLEKAFARFAQQYGQYGGARPGAAAGGSGYNAINSGVPMYAYTVFYGPEADQSGSDVRREDITWQPGQSVLANNPRVVDQLCLLSGRGSAPEPGDTDAPIVTAQAFVDDLLVNLERALPAAIADPDYANIGPLRMAHVVTVQTALLAWKALPPDPPGAAATPKADAKRAIGNACAEAVRPGPEQNANERQNLDNIRGASPARVLFEQGQWDVPGGATGGLHALSAQLVATKHPAVTVKLEGHSSSEGDDFDNFLLSELRADSVETEVRNGADVSPHVISKDPKGEEGASATAEWRRVDLIIDAVEGSNPLHDNARSPAIRALMDLMLDLRNIGSDASRGQRNIYGGHSYSVVAVTFLSIAGAPVPLHALSSAQRPAFFPLIDTNGSTVVLRNPHHTNEPDRLGNGTPTRPEDGAPSGVTADGTFTMSLEEFFRNFNAVDTGVFPRTP